MILLLALAATAEPPPLTARQQALARFADASGGRAVVADVSDEVCGMMRTGLAAANADKPALVERFVADACMRYRTTIERAAPIMADTSLRGQTPLVSDNDIDAATRYASTAPARAFAGSVSATDTICLNDQSRQPECRAIGRRLAEMRASGRDAATFVEVFVASRITLVGTVQMSVDSGPMSLAERREVETASLRWPVGQ